MSSSAKHQVAGAPASQPVFPDEILEEIFLRLDAAEDLARASAACTTFRRVVSARRFLHRFRCLYPPPVLGMLELDALGTFHPAGPPHRSAPAARSLAQAADFTFSFLGTPHRWLVCDAREGRVLLYRRTSFTAAFADLMVCDPLHRRRVQLPAIPDDLAAATRGWGRQEFDPFLDPDTGKDKEKQDLSFHAICALVYLVMLNMHDMELSVVDLPPGPGIFGPRAWAIVEAGEGMIGLFTLSDDRLQLCYKSLRGTEWHHERIIPLPKLNSYWSILDAAAGYLLLRATSRDSSLFTEQESQYFTLNLKTFLLEGLCVSNRHIKRAHLYVSFLLPFSQPSI